MASQLMLYASNELQTDKLYYLLKAFLNTEDQEEKFQLKSDLEGDFVGNPVVRRIYKRIFGQTVKFKANFSKTKHVMDYFAFMSRTFQLLGYDGWVILVDEAELIGRLGKKARLNAYRNMGYFLLPKEARKQRTRLEKQPPQTKYMVEKADLDHVFALFALSASYAEDVIDGKHELKNLEEVYPDSQELIKAVIDEMLRAPQLQPLTKNEIREVISHIQDFHARAYDWTPEVSLDRVLEESENQGFLLRTKLRSAIELFDQLYQYGEAGDIRVDELGKEDYSEDQTPSLDELDQ